MRPQKIAQNPSPAGQLTAAISSAEEYPILERMMEASIAAAREQAKKSNNVLCPGAYTKRENTFSLPESFRTRINSNAGNAEKL